MTFKHGDWRRLKTGTRSSVNWPMVSWCESCDAIGRWVAKSPLVVGAAPGGENDDTKRLIKRLIVSNEDKPKSESEDATTPTPSGGCESDDIKRVIKRLIASNESKGGFKSEFKSKSEFKNQAISSSKAFGITMAHPRQRAGRVRKIWRPASLWTWRSTPLWRAVL